MPTRSTQVAAADVIRVVLQFLREQGLATSAQALQDETQVALNTVDSVEALASDVERGNWESVMPVVRQLKLPSKLLADLYEQLAIELIELRELETARLVMQIAAPLLEGSERLAELESLAAKPHFDARKAYASEGGKERRRQQLAHDLKSYVSTAPPSRLLTLLGLALKWQQQQGQLPAGGKVDLLMGGFKREAGGPEGYVSSAGPTIKFGKKSHAECAAFSPDGQALVTGSVDGFIEVWDYESGKVLLDLPYQAKDDFMMHDEPVLALAFSRDSELLASGSQDGHIKLWRVKTGQCVRRFPKAHVQGVTCLAFSADGTMVASGSFDAIGRVHGLKSGKMLKEMRGHESYINTIVYSPDGRRIVSGSSDASLRVWDAKSGDCVATLHTPPPAAGVEQGINAVAFLPHAAEKLVVCNRSAHIYVMDLSGEVKQTLSSDRHNGGDFVAMAVSSQGHMVHALTENGQLCCFEVASEKLKHVVTAHPADRMAIGVAVHPHRSLVATWADEGVLKTWRD